jgi:ABC-type lipoprotein release transport system permease subunit
MIKNNLNNIIPAAIGVVIGWIIGYFIALNMLRQYEACSALIQENEMLRNIIMTQQETED